MLLNRWLKTLSQPLTLCRRTAPVRRRQMGWQQAAQLIAQVETLEDRTLLATFLVSNLTDSGADSLRDAIEQANSNPGPDELEFTAPGSGSIILDSALPAITETLNINGASAPGFAGTPLVEIDYNGFAGLTFAAGSSGSVLRSLGHINASTSGVTLDADSIILVGNYIGLELDGNTIAGNNGGVLVNSNSNTIGQAGEPRNIISGNTGNGIWINGSTDNEIAGNYIGTDVTGTFERGNSLDGIRLENADNNLIGQNDPVTGIMYDDADDVSIQPVSAWQGIRESDTSDQFLIVGTSDQNGLLFDGTIDGTGDSFQVNYPGAASTSVYGPDNLNGDNLRLVGSYKNADAMTAAVTVNGFVFEGTTAELTESANYRTINQPGAKFNYVHSTMGGLAVGNYDSELAHGTHSLPLGPGHAYIYDISQDAFLTDIMFPGALSNTAYGIWHNGKTSYTIVGGYSFDAVDNFEDPEQPIGQAYLVDYDSATGLFSNWASFEYPNGTNFVTHFEGISSVEKGIYTLNADSAQRGTGDPGQGSFVSVARNADGTFGNATWVDLNFPGLDPATNITSSNSVYGNQVVGVVIGPGSVFSFQATVNVGFQLSNVISGNGGNGIGLYGADDNQIAMNFIGTDFTGTSDLGNDLNGILVTGISQGNLIGGSATGGNDPTNDVFVRPPQGNLISGNDAHGVFLTGSATQNVLSGNFIGTDASGNSPLGNSLDGVAIVNANGNSLIGCTIHNDPFVFYNVISGNGGNGLRVTDSNDTTIQANFFGMGADNNTALGNGLDGVLIEGSSADTLMGGPIPLGNVVAANAGNGIVVKDTASFFTSYNTFAGLAAFSDNLTFGNGLNGMLITSSGSGILIRTNVIARNGDNGIEISGEAQGVRVVGNIIGLNTNGTVAMGNLNHGVEIGGSASNIVIGGPQPTFNIIPYNVISANGASGVAVVGDAHDIQIDSSRIGLDFVGNTAFGNGEAGVFLGGNSHTTTIGSLDPDLLTVISGNLGDGVEILGSTGNTVIGSLIGTGAAGLQSLPNVGNGISVAGSTVNALTVTANTIEGGNINSPADRAGIRLLGALSAAAVINVDQNFIRGFPHALFSDDLASGATVTVFNNSLTGNTVLEVRNGTGTGAMINASGNWWGSNTATGVAARVSGIVDYTPWLDTGIDTNLDAPGFQGDFSTLHVTALGSQSQVGGRINEAIGLVTEDGEVILEAGTFHETVTIDRADLASFTLRGRTNDSSLYVIDAGGADAITITDPETVTIQDLRIIFASEGIVAMGLSTLNLSNLQIAASLSGGTLSNITNVHLTVTTIDDTFDVNDTQFAVSGIPPISYTGVANLSLSSGDGSDTFNVNPLSLTLLTINGNAPTSSPGDTLNYMGPGVINSTGTGNGTITQTGFETVTFTGIETVLTGFVSVITAPGPGFEPRVQVFDQFGEIRLSILAFDSNFQGGVRVATGDMTGDGIPDIIAAAGPGGGPHVRIFDGVTGQQIAGPLGSFYAYAPGFTGGVFVALADLDGDLQPEIITGAGEGGGPHVKAFNGSSGTEVLSFFAYNQGFKGGVRVAAGDVTGDNVPEIVTGAGPGGGPHVRTFSGVTGLQIAGPLGSFYAYDPGFAGGVYVAVADLDDDQRGEIITGAGAGGGPHVRAFDGGTGAEVLSFFAYDPNFTGGVRVAAGDVTGDNMPEIITGPGPGGGPNVRTFDGLTGQQIAGPLGSFLAYDSNFSGGVYVAGVRPEPTSVLSLASAGLKLNAPTTLVESQWLDSGTSGESDEDLDQFFADMNLLGNLLTEEFA